MKEILQRLAVELGLNQSRAAEIAIEKLYDDVRIKDFADNINKSKEEIKQLILIEKQKEEFKEKPISVNNASANQPFEFTFNLADSPNILIKEIKPLPQGLEFDPQSVKIHGQPTIAANLTLQVVFVHKDAPEQNDIKTIPFLINADPKDLWISKESPKNSIWAKADEAVSTGQFLDKKYVAASVRGRSHAHEGKFRDDHYSVETDLPSGWAIIAVADGAGSAQYAREGSRIATEDLTALFKDEKLIATLDKHVQTFIEVSCADTTSIITKEEGTSAPLGSDHTSELEHSAEVVNDVDSSSPLPSSDKESTNAREGASVSMPSETADLKVIRGNIINLQYKVIRSVFQKISDLAASKNLAIRDFNTTLIYILGKKTESGYVFLTFGVGDCPINIIWSDRQQVELLNRMDVGEFGGGTRFVTMPEIYSSPDMALRFGIKCFQDFDKISLMTDGVYDPKFVTENKLEDFSTFKAFFEDLSENGKIDFQNDEKIGLNLQEWMGFWSVGNHDDRTLVIVY